MLSLLLIIVVMIGIINAVNLHSMYQDADNLLAILTTNDGRFPGMMNDNFHPPAERFRPDTPFTFDRLNNTRSAEMPYQSRYFVVRFDSTGNITETDLLHIAAITEEDATAFANQIYSSNKEKGMYHSYRYKKAINDDGSCPFMRNGPFVLPRLASMCWWKNLLFSILNRVSSLKS